MEKMTVMGLVWVWFGLERKSTISFWVLFICFTKKSYLENHYENLRTLWHFIFKLKKVWEWRIVEMHLKLISSEITIKLLDPIFNCQSFFIRSTVVKFYRFELSTSMSIIKLLSFNFLYENSSPILVISICLQNPFSLSWYI